MNWHNPSPVSWHSARAVRCGTTTRALQGLSIPSILFSSLLTASQCSGVRLGDPWLAAISLAMFNHLQGPHNSVVQHSSVQYCTWHAAYGAYTQHYFKTEYLKTVNFAPTAARSVSLGTLTQHADQIKGVVAEVKSVELAPVQNCLPCTTRAPYTGFLKYGAGLHGSSPTCGTSRSPCFCRPGAPPRGRSRCAAHARTGRAGGIKAQGMVAHAFI